MAHQLRSYGMVQLHNIFVSPLIYVLLAFSCQPLAPSLGDATVQHHLISRDKRLTQVYLENGS